MSSWFKRIAILLILTLALGACSRVGLAYRNLDVIIPWTLSDYLDMNGEQKGWFNERRATQKLINERHLREELDNEVK